MKFILLNLLCVLYSLTFAQISGRVIGDDGESINWATVLNLRTNSGCVTDSTGFFTINAKHSDSIRIQHLSYKTSDFILSKEKDTYLLNRNLNELNEIVVSKNYAAWLAVKSCEKAVAKMQGESRDRMYCNAVKIMNTDTLDQVFLDLDFERNKSGSGLNSVIHNRLIEIQKYSEQFNHNLDPIAKNVFVSELFPTKDLPVIKESKTKEQAMNDNCIFYIATDSQYIKVSFIPKKDAPLSQRIFELTITKKDTSMVSFAMASFPAPFYSSKNFENKPGQSAIGFYYQIAYDNGVSYISRAFSEVKLYCNVDNKDFTNTFSYNLKNYAHTLEKQKKRTGAWVINNNFGFKEKLKSKYSTEFWKNNDFPIHSPYDFDKLRELKQHMLN